MRILPAIFVFCSLQLVSITGIFAQKLTKEELTLKSSLDGINLTEELYRQIDSLEMLVKRGALWNDKLVADYNNVTWDLQYQVQLRKVVDNLETGDKIPDKYFLQDIPYDDFVQYGRQNRETVVIAIADSLKPGLFSTGIYLKDSMLTRIYPVFFSKVASGAIVLQLANLSAPTITKNQVIRMGFPAPPLRSNNLAAKKELAYQYEMYINTEAQARFGPQLINTYLALEAKKIPDKNIDKLIDMRRKFIEYLKKLDVKAK